MHTPTNCGDKSGIFQFAYTGDYSGVGVTRDFRRGCCFRLRFMRGKLLYTGLVNSPYCRLSPVAAHVKSHRYAAGSSSCSSQVTLSSNPYCETSNQPMLYTTSSSYPYNATQVSSEARYHSSFHLHCGVSSCYSDRL
jgi:hypothetical protein